MDTVYSAVKRLSPKRPLQRPFAASVSVVCTHGFFVCQYLIEIMPTIIYWLIKASSYSTDNHENCLFRSKAVIGKESAPKASCGVRGRHLRPWLRCLPIFNRNNANNHFLAYSSLPQLHGQSWVQFIPQWSCYRQRERSKGHLQRQLPSFAPMPSLFNNI